MNKVSEIPIIISERGREKERFWREQAKSQRASGLSGKAYCHEHQLNYDQFSYWDRKRRQQQIKSSELLPVHVKGPVKASDTSRLDVICTLVFKNGHELKIYDQSILPLLCSIWG